MLAILEPGTINPGYAILHLINNTDNDAYVDTRTAMFEHDLNLSVLHLNPPAEPRHQQTSRSQPRIPLLKLRPQEQTVTILHISDWYTLADQQTVTVTYRAPHPLAGEDSEPIIVESNPAVIHL